jgi:preprotein translocase subunit SecD
MKGQNNGFKIGSIVVFLGLTLYYLFPTLQWNLEQRHMADMTESERVQYRAENMEKLNSYQENALSLGLDLQGGMYVTLEIGTPQLVFELAGDFADENLREIIDVSADRAL